MGRQRCSGPGESPLKEELELLRKRNGMRLEGTMIRQAMEAGKAGDWSELLKSDKLDARTSAKLRECYYEVRQEDDERKSIVHQTLQKSTDFLRSIIVPLGGQGEVTLSYVCPHCHRYPVEDYIWWVSTRHGKKQSNWW